MASLFDLLSEFSSLLIKLQSMPSMIGSTIDSVTRLIQESSGQLSAPEQIEAIRNSGLLSTVAAVYSLSPAERSIHIPMINLLALLASTTHSLTAAVSLSDISDRLQSVSDRPGVGLLSEYKRRRATHIDVPSPTTGAEFSFAKQIIKEFQDFSFLSVPAEDYISPSSSVDQLSIRLQLLLRRSQLIQFFLAGTNAERSAAITKLKPFGIQVQLGSLIDTVSRAGTASMKKPLDAGVTSSAFLSTLIPILRSLSSGCRALSTLLFAENPTLERIALSVVDSGAIPRLLEFLSLAQIRNSALQSSNQEFGSEFHALATSAMDFLSRMIELPREERISQYFATSPLDSQFAAALCSLALTSPRSPAMLGHIRLCLNAVTMPEDFRSVLDRLAGSRPEEISRGFQLADLYQLSTYLLIDKNVSHFISQGGLEWISRLFRAVLDSSAVHERSQRAELFPILRIFDRVLCSKVPSLSRFRSLFLALPANSQSAAGSGLFAFSSAPSGQFFIGLADILQSACTVRHFPLAESSCFLLLECLKQLRRLIDSDSGDEEDGSSAADLTEAVLTSNILSWALEYTKLFAVANDAHSSASSLQSLDAIPLPYIPESALFDSCIGALVEASSIPALHSALQSASAYSLLASCLGQFFLRSPSSLKDFSDSPSLASFLHILAGVPLSGPLIDQHICFFTCLLPSAAESASFIPASLQFLAISTLASVSYVSPEFVRHFIPSLAIAQQYSDVVVAEVAGNLLANLSSRRINSISPGPAISASPPTAVPPPRPAFPPPARPSAAAPSLLQSRSSTTAAESVPRVSAFRSSVPSSVPPLPPKLGSISAPNRAESEAIPPPPPDNNSEPSSQRASSSFRSSSPDSLAHALASELRTSLSRFSQSAASDAPLDNGKKSVSFAPHPALMNQSSVPNQSSDSYRASSVSFVPSGSDDIPPPPPPELDDIPPKRLGSPSVARSASKSTAGSVSIPSSTSSKAAPKLVIRSPRSQSPEPAARSPHIEQWIQQQAAIEERKRAASPEPNSPSPKSPSSPRSSSPPPPVISRAATVGAVASLSSATAEFLRRGMQAIRHKPSSQSEYYIYCSSQLAFFCFVKGSTKWPGVVPEKNRIHLSSLVKVQTGRATETLQKKSLLGKSIVPKDRAISLTFKIGNEETELNFEVSEECRDTLKYALEDAAQVRQADVFTKYDVVKPVAAVAAAVSQAQAGRASTTSNSYSTMNPSVLPNLTDDDHM